MNTLSKFLAKLIYKYPLGVRVAHTPPLCRHTFGTHQVQLASIGCSSKVNRLYRPCESYTQELIWCNFKLPQSV